MATVLSRIISGSFIVYMLFKGNNEVKVSFRHFEFDFSVIKDIYQVGFPAVLMQVLASVMIGGLNIILAGYNSTAIAAMGIYFRLQSFVFMPVFGLNQGYLPIVGYNFGYNNSKRVKEVMKAGFLTGFAFTVLGFAIFQLFPEQLIMLFGDSPELMEIGVKALRDHKPCLPGYRPCHSRGHHLPGGGQGYAQPYTFLFKADINPAAAGLSAGQDRGIGPYLVRLPDSGAYCGGMDGGVA